MGEHNGGIVDAVLIGDRNGFVSVFVWVSFCLCFLV